MQAENCNSARLRLALLQFFACITRAINSKYYSTPSYYIYIYCGNTLQHQGDYLVVKYINTTTHTTTCYVAGNYALAVTHSISF